MTSNYLQDTRGNKSSKRLIGGVSLSIGMFLGSILFFASIFIEVKDPATAKSIVDSFFLLGGGLLGIGIAEFFKKKK